MNLQYRINYAESDEIVRHLQRCSESFVPPLSDYVDIKEFSAKIHQRATTIEIFDNERLIGLLAVYLNDKERRIGFITNLSVEKEYSGIGLAKNILDLCFDLAKSLQFQSVELEVYPENEGAIHVYKKFGFSILESKENSRFFTMQKYVKRGQ